MLKYVNNSGNRGEVLAVRRPTLADRDGKNASLIASLVVPASAQL